MTIMKTYFFTFRSITKHYPTHEEAVKVAVFCGLSKDDVLESEMSINWKG